MALNWVLSFASTILVDGIKACKAEAVKEELKKEVVNGGFQMPVHYPRYVRSDYEKMEEWQLDLLLRQYGLNYKADLEEKRKFAMGAFLWPITNLIHHNSSQIIGRLMKIAYIQLFDQ